jgi:hypothetical protein
MALVGLRSAHFHRGFVILWLVNGECQKNCVRVIEMSYERRDDQKEGRKESAA